MAEVFLGFHWPSFRCSVAVWNGTILGTGAQPGKRMFEASGLKAVRQEVEVDRPNAVGILKGDGTGYILSFNGHTDTRFTGTREDLRMVLNVEPDAELRGRIVGDKIQGLGISNMKGGLASFMVAGEALKKSGIKLKGDVILPSAVGEISRAPTLGAVWAGARDPA